MYDIIIIGGGISGLNTLYKLQQQQPDKKMVLLEKNSYYGGRIFTVKDKINGEEYTFPAGAARFNKNHERVIKLLKEFKLLDFRKDKPFSSDIDFIDTKKQFTMKFKNKNGYEYIDKVLKMSKAVGIEDLKKITFQELTYKILPEDEAEFIMYASGYTGQLKNMNAYDAVNLFSKGIRADLPYWSGKYDTLVEKMVSHLKNNGGKLLLNSNVENVEENKDGYKIYFNTKKVIAKKIIFCLPQPALLNISYLKPIHCLLKESITCKPLCRTYAIFKKEDIWFKDINKKIVSNNQLRYIIPMDYEKGLIMISYTDDVYTNYWKKMQDNQSKLKTEIIKLVKETFRLNINAPEKVYVCNWDCGVGYWNRNVDSEKMAAFILNPMPNIYICGENYSNNQSWVEGALETSNNCIKLITSS